MVNAIVQGILLGGLYALFAAGLSLMFGEGAIRLHNRIARDLAQPAGAERQARCGPDRAGELRRV